MGTLKMSKLPKCDFCDQEAGFDAQIKGMSTWANMCPKHFNQKGSSVYTTLVLRATATPSGVKIAVFTPDHVALEEAIYNGILECECPSCGDTRSMEPDAPSYECECGCLVRIAAAW